MTARAELAAALTPLLPARVQLIDHPKDLDAIPARVRAVIMLSRTEISCPTIAGRLMQSVELIVIEPTIDQEGRSEDALDEITDDIIIALTKIPWLAWETATRSTYAGKHPAYKFTLTIATQTKE